MSLSHDRFFGIIIAVVIIITILTITIAIVMSFILTHTVPEIQVKLVTGTMQ